MENIRRCLSALFAVAFIVVQGYNTASHAKGFLEADGQRDPYLVQFLVSGSDYLSIHGLTFDADDNLYVGSLMAQELYKVDAHTGVATRFVGPPMGMSDDIEFGPDGTAVWTSTMTGAVHARRPDGTVFVVAEGLTGVNAVAFSPDGRLFVTQFAFADALWEIYLDGKTPPRKIIENMGGLNGFDFDKDGYLYGPLLFKRKVVRVDVDSGEIKTIASGFAIPVAVNLDSKDNLYVPDSALGQIFRVDIKTGEKTLVATVDPGIDNLALDSQDRLFITNLADNAIYEINTETGAVRTVVKGVLSVPGGLDVATDNGKDTIYLGDLFAYRTIDGDSGKVTDVKRALRDAMELPMSATVQGDRVVTASWFTSAVEIYDRKSGDVVATFHKFSAPVAAMQQADGSVIVAEQGTGSLLKVSGEHGETRKVITDGLPGLAEMRPAGKGSVYLTDVITGQLLKVSLSTGEKQIIADGLDQPEGFDVAPDGSIVLAEVGKKRIVRVDPTTGNLSEIARNLAIGFPPTGKLPPAYITTGVGVSDSGAIYVSSDLNTAIYKITPQ